MDGAHAASCEEMATAMSSAETDAYKGLQKCIETVMAEVCSFSMVVPRILCVFSSNLFFLFYFDFYPTISYFHA